MKAGQKVALVTGAAHGIGRATARQLLDEGWLVGVLDLAAADLERAFGKLTRRVCLIAGDIGEEATAKRAVTATIERFGQLDGVVSNAGIMIRKPIRQLTLAEWRRVLDVNLTAAFLLAKAAERPLRQGLVLPGSVRRLQGRQAAYTHRVRHQAGRVPGRKWPDQRDQRLLPAYGRRPGRRRHQGRHHCLPVPRLALGRQR